MAKFALAAITITVENVNKYYYATNRAFERDFCNKTR